MACMKLGSRPGTFRREGNEWFCPKGLKSDLKVKVDEAVFHLHKFPLVSKSGLFETLIKERGEKSSALALHDFPFGVEIFELCAKFCYGFKFELNASNVVPLFCASDNLKMDEEISDGNLKAQTFKFLHDHVLKNWKDSMQALRSCNSCIKAAKKLKILELCVKLVADECFLTVPKSVNQHANWNGIPMADTSPIGTDTHWYTELATLPLNLFVEVISRLKFLKMDQEIVTGAVNYYAKRCMPGLNMQENKNITISSAKDEQRILVEEIEKILPFQKGTCKLLFGLLRNAKLLNVSSATVYNLERRIGIQLDEADLGDLLIPNSLISEKDYPMYDVDCVRRILDHFLATEKMINEGFQSDAMIKVSYLIDAYLAEIASDPNLKLKTFRSLAAAIPDYARAACDLLYSSIDIYLKAHPWLEDTDREALCQIIDCQKLSLEACEHAVQNHRLPLRTIVQVLFCEQLRLRRVVTEYLLLSDQDPNFAHHREMESMQTRVFELEKECGDIRGDIEGLGEVLR